MRADEFVGRARRVRRSALAAPSAPSDSLVHAGTIPTPPGSCHVLGMNRVGLVILVYLTLALASGLSTYLLHGDVLLGEDALARAQSGGRAFVRRLARCHLRARGCASHARLGLALDVGSAAPGRCLLAASLAGMSPGAVLAVARAIGAGRGTSSGHSCCPWWASCPRLPYSAWLNQPPATCSLDLGPVGEHHGPGTRCPLSDDGIHPRSHPGACRHQCPEPSLHAESRGRHDPAPTRRSPGAAMSRDNVADERHLIRSTARSRRRRREIHSRHFGRLPDHGRLCGSHRRRRRAGAE